MNAEIDAGLVCTPTCMPVPFPWNIRHQARFLGRRKIRISAPSQPRMVAVTSCNSCSQARLHLASKGAAEYDIILAEVRSKFCSVPDPSTTFIHTSPCTQGLQALRSRQIVVLLSQESVCHACVLQPCFTTLAQTNVNVDAWRSLDANLHPDEGSYFGPNL